MIWLSCRNESRILLVHVVYFLQLNILHVKLQSKYYYIASIKNQFVDPEWGILVCTVNLHYVESHHRENLPNRVFKDHWVSRTPLSPRTGWPDNYSYLALSNIWNMVPYLTAPSCQTIVLREIVKTNQTGPICWQNMIFPNLFWQIIKLSKLASLKLTFKHFAASHY